MEDSMEMALKDLPGVCDIISSFGKKSYISCFGTKWEEVLKAYFLLGRSPKSSWTMFFWKKHFQNLAKALWVAVGTTKPVIGQSVATFSLHGRAGFTQGCRVGTYIPSPLSNQSHWP